MRTRAKWVGLFLLLVGAEWALSAQRAYAATASMVQSGTVANTANGIQTVTIAGVDPAKSFLIFETRHNLNRPVGSEVRGRLPIACTNPCTTIEFERVTNEAPPATINIQWYVVTFVSGVRVQRGEVAQDAATKDVTLPLTLAAVNQAFVLWSKTPTNTDTTWDGNDSVLGEITSTTNVQFRSDGAAATHTISWQVVEFTTAADINVQKGSITTMTGATTSVTATLGTAVDVNKTFVLVGLRATPSAAPDNLHIGARIVRAQLTDSTTITIDRATAGVPNENITEIFWQAIELKDRSTVWRGTSNFAAGTAQVVVSMVPYVDVSRAIAFGSLQNGGGQNMGRSPYVGDDILGVGSATMGLSQTQLTLDRNNTADVADVGWFVVEFEQGEAKVVSGSYIGNGVNARPILVGFVPDFVMLKSAGAQIGVFRTSTMVGDASKPATGATTLVADRIEGFDAVSGGRFVVGTDAQVNAAGTMYYWTAFKAGPGKMQVGTYTGGGGPVVTGLGFSPEVVFVMPQAAGSGNASFRHRDNANQFQFDAVAGFAAGITLDADGFTPGADARVNSGGVTYHYVAWNEVPGEMDVGSYTGPPPELTDGRNITGVGFPPELVLVKNVGATARAPVHRPRSCCNTIPDSSLYFTATANSADRIQALLRPDGFQVGANPEVNEGTDTPHVYMAWNRASQPQVATGSYTGDGAAGRAITDVGFQPDVVIVKSKGAQIGVIRTSTMADPLAKPMVGNTGLTANLITSLDASGFTVGSDAMVNSSAACAGACEYHWIAFQAGASAMAVGTYPGTGAAQTIPPGVNGSLGFSPELVFIMPATTAYAIHGNFADANEHDFEFSGGTAGLITAYNPDTFTVATADPRVNLGGITYHYVAWNEIPGQMDVGTYTGDGVNDRYITGVGFEPEYVIVKAMNAPQDANHKPASLGRGADDTIFFRALANGNLRIKAFEPDGFRVGTTGNVNLCCVNVYAYYAWKSPYVVQLTAVRLTSFTATRYDRGVLAEWRTGYEIDNLGFHVYREVDGQRTRVTRSLVAGSGLMAGQGTAVNVEQRYAFWDLDASGYPSAVYWLEDVDFNGTSTWHGPVTPVQGGLQAPPEVAQSEALHERLGRQLGSKRRGRMFLAQGARLERTRKQGPRAAAAPIQTQRALAAKAAVKIAIARSGWYRVTQPELLAAGLDPGVDPRMLRLFIEGVEQAMVVTGEADGRFDAADGIEFYGTGADTPYSNTRVYWLAAGTRLGRRIPVHGRPGDGAQAITTGSFAFTLQQKERSIYFAALRNGDEENWFGSLVSEEEPAEIALNLSNVDAAGAAELEVTLQGVTSTPDLDPDHHVAVLVNDVEVGELRFDGQAKGTQTFTLPGILVEGANTVTMVALGGESDFSLVDVVRLRYAHTYRADADLLRFTVDGPAEVTVAGFASPAIRMVDITDPLSALETGAAVGQDGGLWTATIRVPASGPRTLLAFTDATIAAPASVRTNRPSRWHAAANAADYVAISHAEFMDWVAPLADRRAQQGLTTARVDVEDIYDEFSFGEKDPQALRDFVQRARAAWSRAPRFLLLVGDATIDPRDYAGFGDADFVPTKQIALAGVALETASDDWFADADDDGLPELAVGRLSVRSSAQAERMVAKILDYENAAGASWTRDVLLVADQSDAVDNFEQSSHTLRSLVPSSYTVHQVFSGLSGPDAARGELIDAVNQGQLVVNYIGHGSVSVWGKTGTLLAAENVTNEWHNSTRLPLVVAMNCLNGFFHGIYDEESLAETLLRAPDGGAVAAWASSGLTESAKQARVNQELFRLLFAQPGMTVGEAAAAAKRVVTDRDLRRSWIFFGDPALRLHRPAEPVQTDDAAVPAPAATTENGGSNSDPASENSSSTGEQPAAPVRLADYDADGRDDVLLYEAETGRWSLVLNGRRGRRVTEGVWLARAEVFAARLDADRFVDLFLYAPASGEWMQALGNGDGTFRTASGVWAAGWQVRIANFVGDARDEAFVYQPLTGDWCLGDSRRGFAFRSCGALAGGDLSVADFNRDALADLFISDRAGSGWVAINDGSAGFSIDAAQWPGNWPARATNLAGRSAVDLVLYDAITGTRAERLARAGRSAFRSGAWSPELEVAPVDVSGDDVDDVLLYNPRTGSWSILTNTSSGLLASGDGVWPPGLTIATGDLDGDHRADVLLYDRRDRTWTRCTTRKPGTFACDALGALDPTWTVVGYRR